jgi:dTDP-4-dehydrorhamnose reductase
MTDALVGSSGFVGGTLLRQAGFAARYRSTNISEISGRSFNVVVCAGAPAQKWIANQDPQGDRAKIEGLIANLRSVACRKFILISTVDVFGRPIGVDESTPVDTSGLHAYGLNRRRLEEFVQEQFADHLVVRLPGLVGPGLRKNVIFDFLNGNNLSNIDSRAVFQFYPMVGLWQDIGIALEAGLKLLHLTAEPISVADVSRLGFGRIFANVLSGNPPSYDFRTRHGGLYGVSGAYQYSARETILAVRTYAQSEPLANPAGAQATK